MDKGRMIEVRYSAVFLVFNSVIELVCCVFGGIVLSVYFETGDVSALFGALVLLAVGMACLGWMVHKFFRRTIAVIDDEGVYISRIKRMMTWDEIDFLSCDVEIYDFVRSKHRREKLRCFLKDGDEVYAELTNSEFSAMELYRLLAKTFPEITCYPPDE